MNKIVNQFVGDRFMPKLRLRQPRFTVQKMKFSIKDFSSKCDQIRSFLQIWSHLLNKSLMENFILCAVYSIREPSYFYNLYYQKRFQPYYVMIFSQIVGPGPHIFFKYARHQDLRFSMILNILFQDEINLLYYKH